MRLEKVLNMFVLDDYMRPLLQRPAIVGEYAVASDANALCFFDKNLLIDISKYSTKFLNVQSMVETPSTTKELIDSDYILRIVNNCPLVPKLIECEECDGNGKVDFIYEASNSRDYNHEADCPICNGEGVFESEDEKVLDYTYCVQFGGALISVKQIDRFLKVQKELSADMILLHIDVEKPAAFFQISSAKFYVMGLVNVNESKILGSL
jgi:hypothetical protein